MRRYWQEPQSGPHLQPDVLTQAPFLQHLALDGCGVDVWDDAAVPLFRSLVATESVSLHDCSGLTGASFAALRQLAASLTFLDFQGIGQARFPGSSAWMHERADLRQRNGSCCMLTFR